MMDSFLSFAENVMIIYSESETEMLAK